MLDISTDGVGLHAAAFQLALLPATSAPLRSTASDRLLLPDLTLRHFCDDRKRFVQDSAGDCFAFGALNPSTVTIIIVFDAAAAIRITITDFTTACVAFFSTVAAVVFFITGGTLRGEHCRFLVVVSVIVAVAEHLLLLLILLLIHRHELPLLQ
jgi:hypothetical protein